MEVTSKIKHDNLLLLFILLVWCCRASNEDEFISEENNTTAALNINRSYSTFKTKDDVDVNQSQKVRVPFNRTENTVLQNIQDDLQYKYAHISDLDQHQDYHEEIVYTQQTSNIFYSSIEPRINDFHEEIRFNHLQTSGVFNSFADLRTSDIHEEPVVNQSTQSEIFYSFVDPAAKISFTDTGTNNHSKSNPVFEIVPDKITDVVDNTYENSIDRTQMENIPDNPHAKYTTAEYFFYRYLFISKSNDLANFYHDFGNNYEYESLSQIEDDQKLVSKIEDDHTSISKIVDFPESELKTVDDHETLVMIEEKEEEVKEYKSILHRMLLKAEMCFDYDDWTDINGFPCHYYEYITRCDTRRRYARNGITAEFACCFCGGGYMYNFATGTKRKRKHPGKLELLKILSAITPRAKVKFPIKLIMGLSVLQPFIYSFLLWFPFYVTYSNIFILTSLFPILGLVAFLYTCYSTRKFQEKNVVKYYLIPFFQLIWTNIWIFIQLLATLWMMSHPEGEGEYKEWDLIMFFPLGFYSMASFITFSYYKTFSPLPVIRMSSLEENAMKNMEFV